MPTHRVAPRKRFESEIDKLWKPGDSIQLAIGQKDLLVTPLQMARFYALIANGGKLVKPHVAAGSRTATESSPPSSAAPRAAASARPRRRPGRARRGPRGPLQGDARALRDLGGVFGAFPISDRGQDGDGREVARLGGYVRLRRPVVVVRVRPGRPAGARRLRRDRERRLRRRGRGSGGAQGVREVLRHESYVSSEAGCRPTDGRLRRRQRARAGRAARRRAARRASCAGSTGSCSAPSVRSSPTASGCIAGSPGRHAATSATTSCARACRRARLRRPRRRDADRSRALPAPQASRLRDAARAAARRRRRRHQVRGSQRWLDLGFFRFQPSEFSKLLLVLFLAGVHRRARQARRGVADSRAAVGLALVPTLLVFLQPDIGTALVYAAALAAVALLRRRALAAPRGARRGGAFVVMMRALARPGGRRRDPRGLPARAADRVREPRGRSRRRRRTTSTSRSPPSAPAVLDGRGVEGATQTNLDYLPEHATDFVFASLAEQRGFVGAAVLLLLYLLVIWRA